MMETSVARNGSLGLFPRLVRRGRAWLVAAVALASVTAVAQEAGDPPSGGWRAEVEFGGVATSGNSKDENLRYGLDLNYLSGAWEYGFESDGLRSSADGRLSAQRLYHVGRLSLAIDERSYARLRAAHDNDRFSGFDSQSDLSANYGRHFLADRDAMDLTAEVGVGIRRTATGETSYREEILRLEGNYQWRWSATAAFRQAFSAEIGGESSIFRSESALTAAIAGNWSLRLSLKAKHQTAVNLPIDREATDTETAITLVVTF